MRTHTSTVIGHPSRVRKQWGGGIVRPEEAVGTAPPRGGLGTAASDHAALCVFFFFSLSLLFFTGAANGSSSSSLSTAIHSTGCRLHHGQSGRQICAHGCQVGRSAQLSFHRGHGTLVSPRTNAETPPPAERYKKVSRKSW